MYNRRNKQTHKRCDHEDGVLLSGWNHKENEKGNMNEHKTKTKQLELLSVQCRHTTHTRHAMQLGDNSEEEEGKSKHAKNAIEEMSE